MKTEFALLLQYDSPLMSIEQVAAMMEITVRSLENKIYDKTCPIPMFKVGNKFKAHIADVAKYIDAQRTEALKARDAANDSMHNAMR